MAEYCRQCAESWKLPTDIALPAEKEGFVTSCVCEGCGMCWIDEKSRCVWHKGDDGKWYTHPDGWCHHDGNAAANLVEGVG